jgi:phosphoglucomutase
MALGLSNYIIKNFPEEERKIAVAYDSRIKSDLFAQVASGVFATKYNGYKVYGADGCQITTEATADILAEIQKLEKQ